MAVIEIIQLRNTEMLVMVMDSARRSILVSFIVFSMSYY